MELTPYSLASEDAETEPMKPDAIQVCSLHLCSYRLTVVSSLIFARFVPIEILLTDARKAQRPHFDWSTCSRAAAAVKKRRRPEAAFS